jgi:DNA-binding transcriptional MerR regulator
MIPSMNASPDLWTIEELCAQAALALATDYDGAPNARIRDVPDLRTLRYYTTLGLLDRPAEMRGRTALYGRKHLLQIVAVKRLQTQGLSLAEIQQQLLSKSEKELAVIAQVSDRAAKPARRGFWKRDEGNTSPPPPAPPSEGNAPSLSLHGVPLREQITLLFAPLRPLTEEDVQALRAAAGPLLKYLEKRRLIDPRTEKENP